MAPKATGQVIRRGEAYLARIRTGPGKRPAVKLPTCTSEGQAEARKELMVSLVAKLRKAGRADFIDTALDKAATLSDERLPALVKLVDGLCAGTERLKGDAPLAGTMTVQTFGERWTSGELARLHPDHIREKRSVGGDICRLEKHIYPIVGHITLEAFRIEDAEAVMRSLSSELAPSTRWHVAQSLRRILKMAVNPCRLIKESPLTTGFMPQLRRFKTGPFLHPVEEAALMACTDVPLAHRMLYGVLAREGMRREEAASLAWSALNLQAGNILLQQHKTASSTGARSWALGKDTVEALRRWRKLRPHATLVFTDEQGEPLDTINLARKLRAHLLLAKVNRRELHKGSKASMPMRAHDLRSTFVTLALAVEKSETWVMDRTGHTTSAMLQRYRRPARMVTELGLGWLTPLHLAIPELAKALGTGPGTGGGGTGGQGEAETATSQPDSPAARERAPGRARPRRNVMSNRSPGASPGREGPASADIVTEPGDRSRPGKPVGAQSGALGAQRNDPKAALREALADAVRAAVLAGDTDTVEALVDRLRALDKAPTTAGGAVVDLASRRGRRGDQ